jgi:putative pyruvate formate lyase activating enzyme
MIEEKLLFPRYFDVLEEEALPMYLQCKNISVKFDIDEKTQSLWKKHDNALQKLNLSETSPELSLLDLKIELAKRIFKNCHFCEHNCGVDRRKNTGHCKVKETKIASEFLHLGEERVLVPSHTIFFSGCTFNCVFCQNWDISQQNTGHYVEPELLAGIIQKRKKHGSRNVNWVGGDPTPNLLYILNVLKIIELNIPQIWNSNMYCSIETMKLLNGIIDLYLTDFKFGNDDCAYRLSKVQNYTDTVKRNHVYANKNGEIIIRHLVLPNHVDCCSKPILKWLHKALPGIAVNVMSQYRPDYKALEFDEINHPLSAEQFVDVENYARQQNLYLI